ncbi:MAG: pre-peptidase C-terminal domain-containing protein [Rhodopirellula sp.]|nr:pre-peptidase C-terminal domain-containing protein [Rhodopirellula sp.]
MKLLLSATFLGLTLLPQLVRAQTGYPMVMSLKPTALQVGSAAEIEFHTRYSLFGAYQVLVNGEGVSGEVLHPEKKPGETPSLTTMKVRFTADATALPGVRDVKIATPQGISTVGQLVIVQDPVVYETAKNNTRDQATELPIPATACGVIEANEDVDFFKFNVEAGTELNFHVRCARLEDRIHDMQRHADPMLTIRNAMGGTVAASDNYFFGDPFLSVKFDRAGEYFLEIRDVRYHGNNDWEYSVEVTNRPFISNIYPMGLPIGQETSVELVGTSLPESRQSKVTLPADTPVGQVWKQLSLDGAVTNPVAAFATTLPVTLESDADNTAPAGSQQVTFPAGINGRISQDSDVDCFRFEAKKGEKYTFEVRARRYQSSLDPYLRIVNLDGKQFSENDDLRDFKRSFADSRIENWTVPADGEYAIEIRDMHLRGGDSFVYFIEATKAEPHFQLYADTDKTLLAPGSNGVVFVQLERKNGFTGDVQLHIDGLPEGVEAVCGRILPDKGRDGCIILRAAPDAKLSVGNVRIFGTSTWKPTDDAEPLKLEAVASIYQEMYQPGGGRGHWPVESHTVSIGAPQDVRTVKLSEHDVVLKPGESKKIEVTIERAEGFDKNVSLDMRFFHLSEFCNTFPPGVKFDESKSSKLITGKNLTGHVVITAAADAAPVDRQLIPVTANVSLNFVMKTTFAADPLWVSVAPATE